MRRPRSERSSAYRSIFVVLIAEPRHELHELPREIDPVPQDAMAVGRCVIVSEILVGEGDQVLAGDVLVRLDDTFLVSDLAIVERQLLEIFIRKARFDAERLDQQNFLVTSFPDFARLDNAWALSQIDGQLALFKARREGLEKRQNNFAFNRSNYAIRLKDCIHRSPRKNLKNR